MGSDLKSRCLVLSITSSTFFDAICLTERHDQFEHSTHSKEKKCEDVFSFMHIYERLCIISLWNSPHHGRPKMVENERF